MSDRILAGRYRLVEKIGEGGMAYVYRAIDQNTGHNVAIKVMKSELGQDADYVSRFQREAEAASKMTHHNIVNLLDVGMDGPNRFLVMEYVQGITLKQLIREKGRLSPNTAAQICIRILSALQHAHQNGIIHRDIKPQNILVASDGHIKVADFGIARIANSSTLTRDDSVMGTVYYYSPEQASGQKVGVTSDLYSVGIVLYEMLTGRVPFDGESQVAIAMQHLHARPTPIEQLAPEVPPAIIHVCMMAMAKDPRYRYQSAREMAAELRMALEGRVGEMQPRLAESGDYTAPPEAKHAAPEAPKEDSGAHRPAPKRRVKIHPLGWIASALVAVMVVYGLYIGIVSIYEKVVNSAPVPDLVGIDISQAQRAASRVGLDVEVVEINHPNISAGMVILQAPEEGVTLRKGDSVVLTVSKGPDSQKVPTVVGLTLNDALAALKAYNLSATLIEYVVSGEVQAGFVLTQVPEAGAQCRPGDIVQLTVSGGIVNVQDVTNMPMADAQELLLASGLTVSDQVQFVDTADTSLHGKVAAQSPVGSAQVIQGTPVYLTVYQVPGLTHSAQVTLDLPVSDQTLSVRVAILSGSAENTVYQGEYAPGDTRHPQITITAQLPGDYAYKVYTNGKFAYQQQVTLE